MPQRPIWTGYLKLSLVNCAVAMVATISESEKVRFHVINRKTGHRTESRYTDAETGAPVDPDDQVKGYQYGEHDYALIEDEELNAIALETTHTIDIEMFVEKDSIGWIWYQQPYYLVPNDRAGEEAFSVIRDAMAGSGVIGVSRLVLHNHERAVILEPRGRGIVLWTLRYGNEVKDAGEYFADLGQEKVDAKLLSLVTRLIDARKKPWSPAMLKDPVQERLLDIIARKQKGRRLPGRRPKEEPPSGNVVNILDALRESIASAKKNRPSDE